MSSPLTPEEIADFTEPLTDEAKAVWIAAIVEGAMSYDDYQKKWAELRATKKLLKRDVEK